MTSTPNPDVSLGDTTPDEPVDTSALHAATETADAQPAARQWTIAEILETAKRPERRARVCLRADLEAEHTEVIAELSTLINAHGEVIVDDEASAADVSKVSRARELSARADELSAQMRAHLWTPLFRGMSTEDFAVFQKAHYPDGKNADLTDYNHRIIAATMAEPTVTVDDVVQLRKKLGTAAYAKLWQTAYAVCTQGGVDIPFSPAVSLPPLER